MEIHIKWHNRKNKNKKNKIIRQMTRDSDVQHVALCSSNFYMKVGNLKGILWIAQQLTLFIVGDLLVEDLIQKWIWFSWREPRRRVAKVLLKGLYSSQTLNVNTMIHETNKGNMLRTLEVVWFGPFSYKCTS